MVGLTQKFFGLRGKQLGWMIGFCAGMSDSGFGGVAVSNVAIAGMDFLLFGYGKHLDTKLRLLSRIAKHGCGGRPIDRPPNIANRLGPPPRPS